MLFGYTFSKAINWNGLVAWSSGILQVDFNMILEVLKNLGCLKLEQIKYHFALIFAQVFNKMQKACVC